MMLDWRYFAVNGKHLIHRDLRGPDGIFHRKDNIIRDFDKLADESQVL
jgi:hypothetical protein